MCLRCPLFRQVAALIARMTLFMTGNELPFTFIVDDPAGNSFLENTHAPKPDPNMTVSHYNRTAIQVSDLCSSTFS